RSMRRTTPTVFVRNASDSPRHVVGILVERAPAADGGAWAADGRQRAGEPGEDDGHAADEVTGRMGPMVTSVGWFRPCSRAAGWSVPAMRRGGGVVGCRRAAQPRGASPRTSPARAARQRWMRFMTVSFWDW